MGRRRRLQWAGVAALAALLSLTALVVLMTMTDFGRERTSRLLIERLADRINGRVVVQDVQGNLLTGARLEGLRISDREGRLFLRADTLRLRYGLRALLLRQRLEFADVRLVRPVVVLDQPPGEDWNYRRIFPADTVVAPGDTVPGFGSWVDFEDVTIVGGTIELRRSWSPPEGSAGTLDSAALSWPESRYRIVPVGGGYQAVSLFHHVDARLPRIRFAHPDTAARLVVFDSLRMLALPFQPPAAHVYDVSGRVTLWEDTVAFDDLRVTLPHTRVRVQGFHAFGQPAGTDLRISGGDIALASLRWLQPTLPEGHGQANLFLRQHGSRTRVAVTDTDFQVEGARLAGMASVSLTEDGFEVDRSDFRFESLDTRLIERTLPDVDLPIDATLDGAVRLSGTPEALEVDGRATVTERDGAVSRVVADGGLVTRGGDLNARDLELRFDPLRLSLAREMFPDLPLTGSVTGRARLDGPLSALFRVDADLAHVGTGGGRSHLIARGQVRLADGLVADDLRLRFDPVLGELVRAFRPDFPVQGSFTGEALLDGSEAAGFRLDADVVHVSAEAGRSHVVARGEILPREGFGARALELRMDPLQAGLVRAFRADFPLQGAFTGRALLTGSAERGFDVDADLVHLSEATGRSHVIADGEVSFGDDLRARSLDLRFQPLQVAVLRAFAPDLPLEGTLAGQATLDGSLAAGLTARMDVEHSGPEGPSMVAGTATVRGEREVESFALDLITRPVALGTVGRFLPEAELRGSASGYIVARGTPEAATLDLALDVAGGGGVIARGNVGVGPTARYDLRTIVARFDPSQVSARLPSAVLTGQVDVRGVGTDLATAEAMVDAALADSRLGEGPTADSTRVVARLSGGLAVFDQGRVRLASATADVQGSFGLMEGRTGTLSYQLRVDSLSEVRGLLPETLTAADSARVAARPLPRERSMAAARADSLRAAQDSMVASMAERRRMPAALPLDTAPPLPRDSLSGSLRAEGLLTGNVGRFDARGSALLEDVVLRGNQVGSGELTYAFTDLGTGRFSGELQGQLVDVRAQGFAFDSAAVRVVHAAEDALARGSAEIEAFQDPARDYALVADYVLATDARALFLERLALRFDSVRWASTRRGVVRWAGDEVRVEQIELVNGTGGRIFADGLLPDGAEGDLTVAVDGFQIGHVAALLQDTLDTRGLLSLDARVTGSLRAPRLEGALRVDSLVRAGERLPALSGSFRYAGEELVADVQMADAGRRILTADVRLPVNLAFRGVSGPRLLEREMAIDLVADSVPLAALPELTPAVQDLSGRASGTVRVRGTPQAPVTSGELLLADVSAIVPDAGLTFTEGSGRLRFDGDQLFVDTLVARSGDGEVRVSGTIEVASLTQPVFDLDVVATNAVVLRNERGTVEGDLRLDVVGPLGELRVTGDVVVDEGEIIVPEAENLRRATRLDDPALVGVFEELGIPEGMRPGTPFLRDISLDVTVRIQRDTWLRSADLNVELYTPDEGPPLRVVSAPGSPNAVLEGVVYTDRGEYTIAGRRVELTTGSITFLGLPQPDPLLQLNAQLEVPRPNRQALVILVNVGGYLSAPRVSLSSNAQPPLPESDLLSYLAFGRESSSLLASEGSGVLGSALGGLGVLAEQQLAGLGLGALTDALFTTVERSGQQAGIDVFRVSSATLPDEVNFAGYFGNTFRSIEVEAGEYLSRSRLFVSTRYRLSGGSFPGFFAEYRSPRGWTWRTTWESRFLPTPPTLGQLNAELTRVFGTFLLWNRRF